LSTGDFEPVFRQLLEETAPLSPNTMVRIKDAWEAEYRAWRERPLQNERFLYIWADGVGEETFCSPTTRTTIG
jgi:transposase-like protein